MDKNVLVSVIIPVWNPGEGVVRCISSLRGQTLSSIEMIFVDDRGSDDSMDRIRSAAEEDTRIRVLTNPENRGPGFSRNSGIEAANGEYLAFIDPDDYIAEDYLERLYTIAKSGDLDIAKGRIVYLREDGTPSPHHEQNESIRSGLKEGRPIYSVFTYEHHSAIYRRAMIMDSGARYGLARRAQDTTFLLKACHAAKSIGLDDKAEYYFCERGNSAMHVYSPGSMGERLFSFREQVDYLVSALKDDPHAPRYTNALFLSNLRFFARFDPSPENEASRAAYAEEMREQLLRLPFLDEMKKTCFPVRILAEKGVALPSTPGYLPWEQASSAEWLDLFKLWVGALCEYPEYAGNASYWINQIQDKARGAALKEGSRDAVEEVIKTQLERLPAESRARFRSAAAAGRLYSKLPAPLRKLARRIKGK